jgi:hypothetical protein
LRKPLIINNGQKQEASSTDFVRTIPESDSPPDSPTVGDLWIDLTVPVIKRRSASAWDALGGGVTSSPGVGIVIIEVSSNFTAGTNNRYLCNTTTGQFTCTLPSTPTAGDYIEIIDVAGNFSLHPLIVASGTNNINSISSPLYLDISCTNIKFIWSGVPATGWLLDIGGYISDIGEYLSNTVVRLAETNLFAKAQRGSISVLNSVAASINVNLDSSNHFSHTLTEDTTLALPTNIVPGQSGTIVFTQHASSPKLLLFNSFWKFSGGFVPTLSPTVSAIDSLFYYVLNSTMAVCTMLRDIK